MELKVLGSGNAFNQQGRFNSSYLINCSAGNILIDCGFTVPLALQQNKIEFSEVDYIFITHYHGDHYAGLAALLLGLKYITPKEKPLTIIGPGDVKAKTKELLSVLYNGTEKLIDELSLNFISVNEEGDKKALDGFSFEAFKMVHSESSLPVGYVLSINGTKVGFTGDTCWHEGIPGFLKQCDKAIVECNFLERVGEGHLSVEELEQSEIVQARKSDLYLTHLYEASSKKAKELGYDILMDGDVLDFKS